MLCSFGTVSLMKNLGESLCSRSKWFYPVHWAKIPCSLQLSKAEEPYEKLFPPANNVVVRGPAGIPRHGISCEADINIRALPSPLELANPAGLLLPGARAPCLLCTTGRDTGLVGWSCSDLPDELPGVRRKWVRALPLIGGAQINSVLYLWQDLQAELLQKS